MLSVVLAPRRGLGVTGRMVRPIAILLVLLLPACGGWPDVPESATSRDTDTWPELLPLRQIGGPVAKEDPEAIRAELAARTANLRARADIMRQPAEDADAMEDLRARLTR